MICPLIVVCAKKVGIDYYEKYCINVREDAYLKCDEYQKITKEMKTPADWSKLFSIVR